MSELTREQLIDVVMKAADDARNRRCADLSAIYETDAALRAQLATVQARVGELESDRHETMVSYWRKQYTQLEAKRDRLREALEALSHEVATYFSPRGYVHGTEPPDARNELEAAKVRQLLLINEQAQQAVKQELCQLHKRFADKVNDCSTLKQQLATMKEEKATLIQWNDNLGGTVDRMQAALETINNMSQEDLGETIKSGDMVRMLGAATRLFNQCRDVAQQALKGTP